MNAKEIVSNYYKSDAVINPEILNDYLHEDVILNWHSSKGYIQLNKSDIVRLISDMRRSYTSSRINVHSILSDDNMVSARYTHYVIPIESSNEEMILAQFMSFWEVKDDKLYKGYLMSQLA